ncbi:hypothetical protein BpHYR1_053608 [Brachionus plicatilis]|uniref:Uncharacterized protein n=1 Tax=Brachionus plicatilis TaxID=10195 RepID=A0A3M7PHD9_BRAPC|nr:hypothetical protein BpHYR1_053608 [Brachionus plicatilis]
MDVNALKAGMGNFIQNFQLKKLCKNSINCNFAGRCMSLKISILQRDLIKYHSKFCMKFHNASENMFN